MVTIQQGSEEINSNGGIFLIKKMFEGNESLKMLDAEAKKNHNELPRRKQRGI